MTDTSTGPAPAVTPTPRWLTSNASAVIAVLDREVEEAPAYGTQICEATGLGPGTVYPILKHLTDAGWAKSCAEPAHQHDLPEHTRPGGPPRRYYRLTETGLTAREDLAPKPPAPAGAPICGRPGLAGSLDPPVYQGGMTKRAVR